MAQRRRVLSRWRESKPITPYLMVIAVAPLVKLDLGETACGFAELQRCVPQSVYVAPEQRKILPGAFSRAGDIVQFLCRAESGRFPMRSWRIFNRRRDTAGWRTPPRSSTPTGSFRRAGVSEGVDRARDRAPMVRRCRHGNARGRTSGCRKDSRPTSPRSGSQHAHGDSAFRAEMERSRSNILRDTTAVVRRPVIDTIETDLVALLNNNSYAKGGFVLHMLRSELGDSAFFAGIRDYYAKHKHGTALTADLQLALEHLGKESSAFLRSMAASARVSGGQRRTGERRGAWQERLTVAQTGRFGYFEFPLPVVVVDRSGAQH